jgi:hypothetical protein
MKPHLPSPDDRAFRAAFEACAMAPADFNHRAHVRLAYVYLAEQGIDHAPKAMRTALLRFLQTHGVPATKFHETLTRAWVMAVHHFMTRSGSQSFDAFAEQSKPLLDPRVMLTHYSSQTLFSDQARVAFLAPDLAAIPG